MNKPIVLADDEAQIRSLLKCILSNKGFAVLEAKDGQDALTIIRELDGEISLLVSDIRMPNLDGASLCKKVKEVFPSIPVLLMSGIAEPEECSAGDAFLRKPFDLHLLPNVVADLCQSVGVA